ncbi:MAG TPA: LysE family translocator [Streptosporangiaceae bacterium]|jgi:threonine/homoserine/homoserine lactone efflux protein
MVASLLAFLGVSALVIMTPGQDTALTVRNTLSGGRRGGLVAALGVCSGQTVWTLATSVGLSALLVASEPAFLAVKYVGVAYLLFLGAQAIRDAIRGTAHAHETAAGEGVRRRSAALSFRQGLISDLGNPKMAVFFTSLLPQFGTQFFALMLLGLLFSVMTFLWLAGYASVVASMGDLLRRGRARRILDAVTGTVLVGLGLRLAAEHR